MREELIYVDKIDILITWTETVWLASFFFFLPHPSLSKTTTAREDKYLLQERKENKELSTATTFQLSRHFYHSGPLRVLSFLAQHQIHVVPLACWFSYLPSLILSFSLFLFLSHSFSSVCIFTPFYPISHILRMRHEHPHNKHTHTYWRIWIHNLIQSEAGQRVHWV